MRIGGSLHSILYRNRPEQGRLEFLQTHVPQETGLNTSARVRKPTGLVSGINNIIRALNRYMKPSVKRKEKD